MATGTVKFFNPAKGFGYIAPDDGGEDVFVHASVVKRSGLAKLNQGDRVVFQLGTNRRTGRPAVIDLMMCGPGSRPGARGRASGSVKSRAGDF